MVTVSLLQNLSSAKKACNEKASGQYSRETADRMSRVERNNPKKGEKRTLLMFRQENKTVQLFDARGFSNFFPRQIPTTYDLQPRLLTPPTSMHLFKMPWCIFDLPFFSSLSYTFSYERIINLCFCITHETRVILPHKREEEGWLSF